MADADEKNLIFESDDETNQANGTKKAEGTAGENKYETTLGADS